MYKLLEKKRNIINIDVFILKQPVQSKLYKDSPRQ